MNYTLVKIIKTALILLPIWLFSFTHDKWIVVTTIQSPTDSIKNLAKLPGWQLLVIGDKKTPPDWYVDDKCIYLSPEDQEKLPFQLCKLLPWNHYSRKNIGYLYAIAHGAELIYETDDDNGLIEGIQIFKNAPIFQTLSSSNPVINVYDYFGQPTIWPRGYPLSFISQSSNYLSTTTTKCNVVIEQGLVNGDPDVDAIFRLTRIDHTNITFNNDLPPCILSKGSFCPFNTQNTLFHKEAFWGLYIPSYVPFRTCDIYRGYFTQRVLWETRHSLCFTVPTAIQIRNDHDFLIDFFDEHDLYFKTNRLIEFLSNWSFKSTSSIEANFYDLYRSAIVQNFIDEKEIILVQAWLNDLAYINSQLSH